MSIFRFTLTLLLTSSFSALAAQSPTVTLNIDNDGVFGIDQDYTSGVFISYTSGAVRPNWWSKPLSLSMWGAASLDKWEFSIGHKMWTPSDITLETPEPNERPYAGLLHGEFNYISLHPQQSQRFNLMIGTTGENSLSRETQNLVHSITKSDDPNGWAYQVEDKVVANVGYSTHFNLVRRRFTPSTEFEISNISEINLGNFREDVSTGFMVRWGQDLAGNFGSAQISAESPFKPGMIGASNYGWFVFGGIEARYRFNDITIEGERPLNGLEHPASYYQVTLENWQSTAVVGAVWYTRHFGFTFTTTANTSEYKEDKNILHGTGGVSFYAFF
ncbi:lipid A deacylase LpxR family protein [Vibrio ziniensis]|uniref:DUF2219 family protein n=1 Tax=Vibrio ziniensis TaxID=2711221 RepID=A0A6G7CGZ5_9VIBR|nr:lipid A-modifier LpxR family protein [Vibrio ziniensis]QIH41343.1 DUF2219 family protein [Vibrio ziniensis]